MHFQATFIYVLLKFAESVSVKGLINGEKENQKLLHNVPGQYEIIYPVQVHHNHGRRGISTVEEVLSNTVSRTELCFSV